MLKDAAVDKQHRECSLTLLQSDLKPTICSEFIVSKFLMDFAFKHDVV